MRKLLIFGLLCSLSVAVALADPVATPDASTTVAPAITPAPTASTTLHIGTVDVTGIKHLVETLEEIKVAVKRPFDNDPKHFDDMVCSLEVAHAMGTLDCGTQGFYGMRRNEYLFGNFGGAVAVSTLGHPWHAVRSLNMKQVKALREALKALPEPGKGDVEVVDDTQTAPAK